MSGKLLALNDSLARSICSYLDVDGLSQLAGANKKFHALSPGVDSDAGKIQTLVQRCRLRDLGLRVAYPEDEQQRRAGLVDAGSQRWLFTRAIEKKRKLTLSQNGLFISHSLEFNAERYINGSSRYLFTAKANDLQVRDPQGNLLVSISAPILTGAFELPFRQNQQLILVVLGDKLEVWDIAQKENTVPILVHPIPAETNSAEQFDNILVLECFQRETPAVSTFFVYDMNDLEKPPQELVHPRNSAFSSNTFRNASQLFLFRLANSVIAACIPKTGNISWEISPGDRYAFACANEKWLVLFFSTLSYEEMHVTSIKVVDAKTGVSRGEFSVPYSLKLNEFTLWGKSILVAKKEDALLFWLLPEGRALPSWKLENCKIRQVIVSGKQLVVHYEDRSSGQYRVISLNTPLSPEEAGAVNDLPKLTLIQPERKELSLCDRIWACVSLIFDWLADIFRWLFC